MCSWTIFQAYRMRLREDVSKPSLGVHSGALFRRHSGSVHLTLMKSSTQFATTNGPPNKHIVLSSRPTHKLPPSHDSRELL
ncbi:isochorismatase family protein family [Moniliophthora roreri]|nr:isochorismatase family protein family [Moniliophthora roreri]